MINRIRARLRRFAARFIAKKKAQFPEGRKVVSFTFDDFPISAIENGARLLEAKNLNGTFYATLGEGGKDSMPSKEEMLSISRRGHECGCHTFGHIDCGASSAQTVMSECIKNQQVADKIAGLKMRSFAYPFGEYNPSSKKVIGDLYDSARTVEEGINSNKIDLAALYGVPIYENRGIKAAESWIRKLQDNGGWLIFYTHDVSENPSDYGSSIELFSKVLNLCLESEFEILTISQAVDICISR